MPYLDHAATTPLDPRVREEWMRLSAEPLNPASIHQQGQKARRLLEHARERLAAAIGLERPDHLVFTSGATESANLALRGMADAVGAPTKLSVVTSAIEHSCVRDTIEALDKAGRVRVAKMDVATNGRATISSAPEVQGGGLMCLMHANNETGVIQDSAAALDWKTRHAGAWLCDASQSLGKVRVGVDDLGADLVIFSAHKCYGPPGIACLAGPLVPRLAAQHTGGAQEDERRAGTEAVALASAFALAAEIAREETRATAAHLREMEHAMLSALDKLGVAYRRNGMEKDDDARLPGFLNLSFAGHKAVDLAIALDMEGFAVSPGSACSTGVVAVSPVLEAMFPLDAERAAGGLRITMGRNTTAAEVVALANALSGLVLPHR